MFHCGHVAYYVVGEHRAGADLGKITTSATS